MLVELALHVIHGFLCHMYQPLGGAINAVLVFLISHHSLPIGFLSLFVIFIDDHSIPISLLYLYPAPCPCPAPGIAVRSYISF